MVHAHCIGPAATAGQHRRAAGGWVTMAREGVSVVTMTMVERAAAVCDEQQVTFAGKVTGGGLVACQCLTMSQCPQ